MKTRKGAIISITCSKCDKILAKFYKCFNIIAPLHEYEWTFENVVTQYLVNAYSKHYCEECFYGTREHNKEQNN